MRIGVIHKEKNRPTEGATKIADKLKDTISNGFKLVDSSSSNLDCYHVFSNGFYEALKYRKFHERGIFSLLTNIDFSSKRTLQWLIEDFRMRRNKDHFLQVGNVFLSAFIPIKMKRDLIDKFRFITVPTQYLKENLKFKKARVIPFGINVNKFHPIEKGNGIAFLGAAVTSKGYPDLYKAVQEIKADVPVCFYFSSEADKMKDKLEKNNIKIHGVQKDLVRAYNKNKIICLPFRQKNSSIGIPLTLLEAMACERAIITTNLPHLKEVAGDSVLYVDPYSPNQIKEKIEILLSDEKLRKELGKKARQRVLEHYTEEHMIDGFIELYEEILEES